MKCIRCGSGRILSVNGKTSDCYSHTYNGKQYEGYVPDNVGIGGDDYIEFNICLECGQVQDTFPKDDPGVEYYEDDDLPEGHPMKDVYDGPVDLWTTIKTK